MAALAAITGAIMEEVKKSQIKNKNNIIQIIIYESSVWRDEKKKKLSRHLNWIVSTPMENLNIKILKINTVTLEIQSQLYVSHAFEMQSMGLFLTRRHRNFGRMKPKHHPTPSFNNNNNNYYKIKRNGIDGCQKQCHNISRDFNSKPEQINVSPLYWY